MLTLLIFILANYRYCSKIKLITNYTLLIQIIDTIYFYNYETPRIDKIDFNNLIIILWSILLNLQVITELQRDLIISQPTQHYIQTDCLLQEYLSNKYTINLNSVLCLITLKHIGSVP